MPRLSESFPEIVAALRARYGPPAHIADGLDPFEALAAVLLERSIDAKKLPRALSALSEAGLLDARPLADAALAEVSDTLRSAGIAAPARTVAPLARLARWLVEQHDGTAAPLIEGEIETAGLREELAALNGIGPATADSLLLFALRRPAYPVDRATYRILVRHGWLDSTADYDEARDTVERQAPGDPETLAQLSAWFAQVGRDACRASTVKCDRCPLRPFLPEDGPREMDGG